MRELYGGWATRLVEQVSRVQTLFQFEFLVHEKYMANIHFIDATEEKINSQSNWKRLRKVQKVFTSITFAPKILFERIVEMISFLSAYHTDDENMVRDDKQNRLVGCCWSWLDT